jgi:carbonic anhydrase/acetyltransferase-like protein (isoleucine patch superfamily)
LFAVPILEKLTNWKFINEQNNHQPKQKNNPVMKPMHTNTAPRFTLKGMVRNFMYATLAAAMLAPSAADAQLKIGDNPTQITPSAILELNSTQQGFLLPRLNDWTIDATFGNNIPDGMVVYYTHNNNPADDSSGIYIRRNDTWQRITTSANANKLWSRQGNTITDGADTLGSLNNADLKIITNGMQRILVEGADGYVRFTTDTVSSTGHLNIANGATIGENLDVKVNANIDGVLNVGDSAVIANSAYVGKALHVTDSAVINGSLYLHTAAQNAPFSEVLVIDPATGVVARRTIDTTVFRGWTVGNFDETGIATGIERREPVNGTDPDTLILHAATATTPGGVSITTQEFAGNKTFQDSLTAASSLLVGTTGVAAQSTLQVEGSMSIKVNTVTANYALGGSDHTVLANANGITLTLPSPSAAQGRVYVIKKTAGTDFANSVKITGDIEGGGPVTLDIYNQGTSYKLQSDGASWWIIDRM